MIVCDEFGFDDTLYILLTSRYVWPWCHVLSVSTHTAL